MTAAAVLVPTKFVTLIGQLLISIVILHTKNENIYSGLPPNTLPNSDLYSTANTSVQAVVILTIILCIFEILILFFGYTMFYDSVNILQCLIHGIGAILYSWFMLDKWHYQSLLYLWIVFSLFPFIIELFTMIIAFMFYRKFR